MAYFSNGTEGSFYEEKYCSKCVHRNGPDGKTGCTVWLAHLLFAYELCNSECAGKEILDLLIPMQSGGMFADKCSMFHEGEAVSEPIPEKQYHSLDIMPGMRAWAKEKGLIP